MRRIPTKCCLVGAAIISSIFVGQPSFGESQHPYSAAFLDYRQQLQVFSFDGRRDGISGTIPLSNIVYSPDGRFCIRTGLLSR